MQATAVFSPLYVLLCTAVKIKLPNIPARFLGVLPPDEDDDDDEEEPDTATEYSSILGATIVTGHLVSSLSYSPSATAMTVNSVVPSSDHCTAVPGATDGEAPVGTENPSVV